MLFCTVTCVLVSTSQRTEQDQVAVVPNQAIYFVIFNWVVKFISEYINFTTRPK